MLNDTFPNYYQLPEAHGRFSVMTYIRPAGFRVHNRAEIDSYIEELAHRMAGYTTQSYVTVDRLATGARFVNFLTLMGGAQPHFRMDNYTPDSIIQMQIANSPVFAQDPLLGLVTEFFLLLMSAKRSKVLDPGTFSPDLGFHVSPLIEKANVGVNDGIENIIDGTGMKTMPILTMDNVMSLLRVGAFYKVLQRFRREVETSPIHSQAFVTIGQLADIFILSMDVFKTLPTEYMNIRVMSEVNKKFRLYFLLSPMERQEIIHHAPTDWFWTNLNFQLSVYADRVAVLKASRSRASQIRLDVNGIPLTADAWNAYISIQADGETLNRVLAMDTTQLPDSYYYRMIATEFSTLVRECPFIKTVDAEQFLAMYDMSVSRPAGKTYLGKLKTPLSAKDLLRRSSALSKQLKVDLDDASTPKPRRPLMRLTRQLLHLAAHQEVYQTQFMAVTADSIISAQLLRAIATGSASNSAIIRHGSTPTEARVWPTAIPQVEKCFEAGELLLQRNRYYVALNPVTLLKERLQGFDSIVEQPEAVPSLMAHVTTTEMLAFAMIMSSYDPFTGTFSIRDENLDKDIRFTETMSEEAILTEGRITTGNPELVVLLSLLKGGNPFTASNPIFNTDNLRLLPKRSGRLTPVFGNLQITGCHCKLKINGQEDNVRIDGMSHLGVEPGTVMSPILHSMRMMHEYMRAHHTALVSGIFGANEHIFQNMVLSGVMELINSPAFSILEPALPITRLGYDTAYALPLLEMQLSFLSWILTGAVNLSITVDVATLRTIYYNRLYRATRDEVRI